MPASASARSSSLPGRADERLARAVLVVAGLLADEHDPRVRRPLAEHGLRGRLPQLAGPAPRGRARSPSSPTPVGGFATENSVVAMGGSFPTGDPEHAMRSVLVHPGSLARRVRPHPGTTILPVRRAT